MAAFPKILLMGAVLCTLVMAGMPTALSGMRHMRLHVFVHDTLNKTDVLVARNMSGATITTNSASFGSVFVFTDGITAAQDPSSAILGSISGLFTSVSADGRTFFTTATAAFDTTSPAPGTPANLRGLNGTINIMGLFKVREPAHPLSVVGGAGTFALAQGSATMHLIDIRTFVQVSSLDIDVYMPF